MVFAPEIMAKWKVTQSAGKFLGLRMPSCCQRGRKDVRLSCFYIHFVSCKLEDTAGITIALVSLMTIPAVIHPYVRDAHFYADMRIFNKILRDEGKT